MDIILKEIIKIHPSENKSNISLSFQVEKPYAALYIRTAYSPKDITDEDLARKEIEAGLAKYVPEEYREQNGNWRDYLPLKNFVTLSLDCEDEYIGCAHRHAPVQDHIIAEAHSSPGFIRHAVTPGNWKCVLNCHAVIDDPVSYSLTVYGLEKGEEANDHL